MGRRVASGYFDPEGEPDGIAACLRRLEDDPGDLALRRALIRLAWQQGAFDIVVYQWLDMAELHHLAGELKQANECYETILRLEETVMLGPHARADAVQVVRQLVSCVKPEVYLRIGEFRLSEGSAERALQYLLKADELRPGIWDVCLALGRCYLALGKPDEACVKLRQVLVLTEGEFPELTEEVNGLLRDAER